MDNEYITNQTNMLNYSGMFTGNENLEHEFVLEPNTPLNFEETKENENK